MAGVPPAYVSANPLDMHGTFSFWVTVKEGNKTTIDKDYPFTGYGEVRTTVQAMKLGAIEFLEKPFSNSELIDSVQAMLQTGHQQELEQNMRNEIRACLSALSEREREVAELIARGLTSREIAQMLSISPRTVDAHRARALEKTNCSTSAELAALFSRFS